MADEPNKHDAAARARLAAHRGRATWGARLVPLNEFRIAAAGAGIALDERARRAARAALLDPRADATPVEGPFARVAVCGGVYSNHFALAAFLEIARGFGAEAVYCLGDLGAFGPSPESVRPLLAQGAVRMVQGNYEQALASGRDDCNCGYTDPRDNHFAALSYRYTAEHCSTGFKSWMGDLPERRRFRVGRHELLAVHGSPRRVNEFLFDSTTPDAFLELLLDRERADGLLCTHTGLHWQRTLASGRQVANVGVLGRPANDGATHVWGALLEERGDRLSIDLVPVLYDHQTLADAMRREELPAEFIETIRTGWWTTCLEVLPARERSRSLY